MPAAVGFDSPRDVGYGFHAVAVWDGRRRLAARRPATTRPLIRKSWRVALFGCYSCDRQRVECDLIAEVVELSDEASGGAGLAGAFDEVVRAEVVVSRVVGEHVPDSNQNRVLQRDEGPFTSATGHHASITSGQVGIFAAGGSDRGLSEHGLEPGVPGTRGSRRVLSGGLVVTWTDTRPRRQVPGTGE